MPGSINIKAALGIGALGGAMARDGECVRDVEIPARRSTGPM